MYTCLSMCVHTCMYAYTYPHMYTHICKHAHVCIHTDIYTYTCNSVKYSVPSMCAELITVLNFNLKTFFKIMTRLIKSES